jgi:hypothetical protein
MRLQLYIIYSLTFFLLKLNTHNSSGTNSAIGTESPCCMPYDSSGGYDSSRGVGGCDVWDHRVHTEATQLHVEPQVGNHGPRDDENGRAPPAARRTEIDNGDRWQRSEHARRRTPSHRPIHLIRSGAGSKSPVSQPVWRA